MVSLFRSLISSSLLPLACALACTSRPPPARVVAPASSSSVAANSSSPDSSLEPAPQEESPLGDEPIREPAEVSSEAVSEATESPSPEVPSWLEDGRGPDPSRALPALSMRHIGMHIGGESNTSEAKKPWLLAIEKQTTALLKCYRWVNEPLAGGTVGVDLYVTAQGGSPEVRKTRQRLGGDEFDACIRAAFQRAKFPAPKKPTVLSYSLRYDVQGS